MLETRAGLEPGSPLLPKPFTPDSLTKKVGEVLATRSLSPSPFARAPRTTPRPDPWWPWRANCDVPSSRSALEVLCPFFCVGRAYGRPRSGIGGPRLRNKSGWGILDYRW